MRGLGHLAPRSVHRGVGAAAIALLILVAPACQKDCRPDTLFLDLDLGAAAGQADTLHVDVIVDGMTKHSFVSLPAGRSSGGLEISFPSGYPAGKTATVTLNALHGPVVVVATTSKMITLSASCTRASIAFPASDAGADGADAAGTGGSRDAAGDGEVGSGSGGGGGQSGGAGGVGTGGRAGTGGAGTGGSPVVGGCGTARDFNYPFPQSQQGFVLSTFADPDQTNLASLPGSPVSLDFDPTTNEPAGAAGTGSLKVTATFTAYNQYVDVILDFPARRNLAAKIACAQVRLSSGLFAGGVHLHASSGVNFDGYATGTAPALVLGSWTTFSLPFDAPAGTAGPWTNADVSEIGVQIYTGDPPIAGAVYPLQGPAVFHIDSIAD